MKITNQPQYTPNGQGLSVAIITSRFNVAITDNLLQGCLMGLKQCGVQKIGTYSVPGALEIPFTASCLMQNEDQLPDAIIALGCIIKGDTYHFEVVCDQSAQGLMALNTEGVVPVINSVLTVYTNEQALERSVLDPIENNKGYEAALVAVEMALLQQKLLLQAEPVA